MGAAVAACAVVLTGCGTTGSPFYLSLHNDTPQEVVVAACEVPCTGYTYTVPLVRRQSGKVAQWPDGGLRPMKVLNKTKRVTLGCLPFRFHRTPPAGTVVDVSRMVPCGDDLGASATGGQDWPYRRY